MSTATLQIEKKRTLVPQLRFQEFDDEWKQTKLGNVCDKIQDGNYGGEYPKAYEFVENGIPFLTSKALGSNGLLKEDKIDFIPIEKHIKLKKAQLKLNDVLFTNRGSNVGSIGLTDIRIAHGNIGPQLTLLRSNLKIIIPSFLYQIMKSETTVKQIRSQDSGSAMNFFGIDTTSKFKLSIPTLQEQQKIASFLSVVDEKIQQLSRKKELLEQYKKGVMQQLFSGKLRFKDENGEDYPDWEEKNFGDIFSFYTTNSLSREKLNYESGEVKNIHYGDIHTKFKTLFDINNELVPFINSDFDVSKIKSECYCQEGDLVIADASEDYADIGKSIEIVNLHNKRVIAGLHTYLARPNKVKMYIGFSGYIVHSDNFRKQIMTIAQGSKVLSISTGRIEKVKMKIPIIEEQQKIAEFLSNIDYKIESINQQVIHTKTFKKGLLQQMFI